MVKDKLAAPSPGIYFRFAAPIQTRSTMLFGQACQLVALDIKTDPVVAYGSDTGGVFLMTMVCLGRAWVFENVVDAFLNDAEDMDFLIPCQTLHQCHRLSQTRYQGTVFRRLFDDGTNGVCQAESVRAGKGAGCA